MEAVKKIQPKMQGSTYFGLLAEFGTAEIPLSECCEKYFGLDSETAKRRAAECRLPVPAFKAGSQRAQWLISAGDLAELLDRLKDDARKEHRLLNG